MQIIIINGPNLNLLGTREPDTYGNTSFQSYLDQLKTVFQALDLHYYQSNIEGEIINKYYPHTLKKSQDYQFIWTDRLRELVSWRIVHRLSVCLSVCPLDFSHFKRLLHNPLSN